MQICAKGFLNGVLTHSEICRDKNEEAFLLRFHKIGVEPEVESALVVIGWNIFLDQKIDNRNEVISKFCIRSILMFSDQYQKNRIIVKNHLPNPLR